MLIYNQFHLQTTDILLEFFSEIHRFDIFGFFVLLNFDNELEIFTSDISFDSVYPWQIWSCIRIYLVGNLFQCTNIRNNTKMPTLCISLKKN